MSNTEILTKAKEYKELQQFIKQLEEEAEALKAAMVAEMDARETDTISTDLFTIKYTAYTSARFDSKAFKSTHSDLYSQYTKEVPARRFQVA